MAESELMNRMRVLAGLKSSADEGLSCVQDYFIPARDVKNNICTYCGTKHNSGKYDNCKNCGAPIE